MTTTVVVGSRKWCDDLAAFYLKQAEKFSRGKYPLDEQQMWHSLLMHEFWKHTPAWH